MFHLKAVLLFHKSSFWVPILAAEGPYLMKIYLGPYFYVRRSLVGTPY